MLFGINIQILVLQQMKKNFLFTVKEKHILFGIYRVHLKISLLWTK